MLLLFFSTVILLAALTTGRNVIFLIFSMLVSYVFVSSILGTISLYRLRVERLVPQHIFSGKPFLVETKVANNKKFFSSFSLVVSNILDRRELPGRYILKLPAQSCVSVAHKYLIEKRGKCTFRGIKVTTTYPLDLLFKGYTVVLPEPIIVYPRIVRLNPSFLNAMVSEIENQVNRPGMGTDLYGFRKYQDGEDSRFINWRLSAKTQNLLVTKFCQEENLRVCVLFDNTMEMTDQHSAERFESAVTFVASLCSFFVETGFKVKLVTRNEAIPYGEGNKQLYRILTHLALIQPATPDDATVNVYSAEHPEQGIPLLVHCGKQFAPSANLSRNGVAADVPQQASVGRAAAWVFDTARMEGI